MLIILNQIIFHIFFSYPHYLFDIFFKLDHFLVLANFIFSFGILGIILNKRNFLVTMIFIEVMYTGLFMYFIISSLYINMPIGQVFALVILIAAACESVIGLGILLILFRFDNSILLENFAELRG